MSCCVILTPYSVMSASQSLEDFDDSDGSVSDDNHVYSESEAEDEDGDHEPLPDVNDILKSGKTWDMLSLHEVRLSVAFSETMN